MKKLMITAAAALCATVGFSSIESSNVVGYQGIPVADGMYNFMVATFDKVDGSVMKLGDIGVDENYSASTLSFLNAADASTRTFYIDELGESVSGFVYYFKEDLEGTDFEGKPGWYYDVGGLFPMNDIEIPYGTMFYVEGAEDCNIVASGVVLKGAAQPIEVLDGMYNFMGNVTPKNLKLGDIGVDEDYSASTLSFLNAADASTRTFFIEDLGEEVSGFVYYFAEDLEGSDFEGKPGWYYDVGGLYPMNDIEIPAGSMFYVEGAEDCNILIPAAL